VSSIEHRRNVLRTLIPPPRPTVARWPARTARFLASDPHEVVNQLRWLSSMGIETVIGWVVGVDRIDPIEVMGREVITAVADR
jgi:hypothetical protein